MSRISLSFTLALVLSTTVACENGALRLGAGGARGGAILIDEEEVADPADQDDPDVSDPDDGDLVPVTLPVPPEPVDFDARVIQDCDVDGGYEVTGFSNAPVPGLPTVTAVSVYQTRSDHSGGYHPMGAADLQVLAAGPQVVAVASYEPTTWNLTLGADTDLQEILVFGYHDQVVEGAGSIPVTFIDDPVCGYAWPDDGQGCDTQGLVDAIELHTGQAIQHFEGCYDATSFVIDGDPAPAPTEALPIIEDCATDAGYEVDSFHTPAVTGLPELWLVGIYETHSNHSGGNHPMGYATVDVDAPGTHTLALSSYEPVTWQLDIGPDSTIDEILLFGYHQQLVEGAGNVPVTFVDGPSCGYSWPYNGQGCDTNSLVAAVETAAGQDVNHFEGCYRATDFTIDTVASTPAPTPVTDPNGIPVDGVPCGPGATVELAFPIPAEAMASGASDPSGAGWCSGSVTFSDDLAVSTAGNWDYDNDQLVQIPWNGFADQQSCNTAHCNDLMYGDGSVTTDYCSLYAVCENGVARSTGFTW